MTPWRAFELEGWASMCMRLEPSLSKRIGVPPTAARLPTPGLESCRPVTSWVETNPADVFSNRNATPLPETTVESPPPPLLPALVLPMQVPEVGGTYVPNPPP